MNMPERGPSPGGQQERKDSREDLPSEVHVYVVELAISHADTVSQQGFGHSTPLAVPERRITYNWKGKLHSTTFERSHPQSREGYTGSSNAHADIAELARNFAYNYRERQNPDLEKQGSPSYTLQFGPPEEVAQKVKEQYGDGAIVRGLTAVEQKAFMNAFQEANIEVAKEKR